MISDAKSILIEKNTKRAEAFVSKLGGKIKVTSGEERLRALNLAILELERELLETDDSLREMEINNELATLLQIRANLGLAQGFNKVVAFSDAEKKEITSLLAKVKEALTLAKT